jgi:hypothetical protein
MTVLLWTLSYFGDYARIALENYTSIEKLLAKRKIIAKKYDSLGKLSEDEDREFSEINREINKYSRIVIVFCALSLEAFINDYAIEHLSKSYLEKYLDKLDLYSKWVVIPRLLTGSQLDTGAKPMQDLDWLIKQRNRLVHFKTEAVEVSKVDDKLNLYNEKTAGKAILTVKNIILALHKIDKRAHETWLLYKDEWFPSKRLDSR